MLDNQMIKQLLNKEATETLNLIKRDFSKLTLQEIFKIIESENIIGIRQDLDEDIKKAKSLIDQIKFIDDQLKKNS
mgnify:CR=1 FL=1